MAQVDYLIPAAPHVSAAEQGYLDTLHSRYVHATPVNVVVGQRCLSAEEDLAGASSLPTPPPEELEIGGFPPTEPFVAVPGLPRLSSGSPEDLIRSRILQAVFDAQMNEVDAERAFFVADLSKVYEKFMRWRYCLPNVDPFYGM